MSEQTKPVTVYGADWCGDTVSVKRYFDSNNIVFTYVNIETDSDGLEFVLNATRFMLGERKRKIPVVKVGTGKSAVVMIEPNDNDLESALSESCSLTT